MTSRDFNLLLPLIIVGIAPVIVMISIAIKRYHPAVNIF